MSLTGRDLLYEVVVTDLELCVHPLCAGTLVGGTAHRGTRKTGFIAELVKTLPTVAAGDVTYEDIDP